MEINMHLAKKRLTVLWFSLAALPFVILTIQTMFNRYGEKSADIWAWLLSQIMPTLFMTTAVWAADFDATKLSARNASRFSYRLSCALSAFYLLLVLMVFVIEPFFPRDQSLLLFNRSAFFLAPLQALTGAILGVFFTKE
jgi:hypothetical protein